MIAGHGPLLPDREVLPRRGPARRPPARVHAGGRRDLVRARRPGLRAHRAADRRDLQGDRRRACRRRSAACRTPRPWRSTDRTSPTCASASRSRTCRTSGPTPPFNAFRKIVADGGVVRALVIPGAARYSRSELDALVEQAKQLGAVGHPLGAQGRRRHQHQRQGGRRGQAARSDGRGRLRRSGPDPARRRQGRRRVEAARRVPAVAGEEGEPDSRRHVRVRVGRRLPAARLGRRRQALGRDAPPVHRAAGRGLRDARQRSAKARAKAYDLVLNGSEIGGGSIRIHDCGDAEPDLPAAEHQRRGGARCASASSSTRCSTARRRTAASRSASIASIALLAGESSIREVIAFPKTAAAVDLMSGAPSPVDQRQLDELTLRPVVKTSSPDKGQRWRQGCEPSVPGTGWRFDRQRRACANISD